MSGIEAAPQPWIAAVNGFALGGGCELALACDIRIAGQNAKFGQPEINLGITPGFGGTQRLPRAVGDGWAKYLVLSGRHIRADEALRIGLVQAVVAKDELMTQAMKLAEELAGKSPLAMRYCKAAVQAASNSDITTGQGIERDLFALAFASEDQSEGMSAFLEKRAPEFNGR
jgi:enoyl-CoA hydratase